MSSSQGYPPLPSLSKANRSIYCVVNCHICFLNLVRTEFISSLVGFSSFLNVLTKSWVCFLFFFSGWQREPEANPGALGPLIPTSGSSGTSPSPLWELWDLCIPTSGSSGASPSPLPGALEPLHHFFVRAFNFPLFNLLTVHKFQFEEWFAPLFR